MKGKKDSSGSKASKSKLTPMGHNYGGSNPKFLGKMEPGSTTPMATGGKGSKKRGK